MEQPPPLGFGLGLRPVYYEDILAKNPRVDWFEVISENFMVPGGRPLAMLERIRGTYPIVMHGVSMSIASTAPLDFEYLRAVKSLAGRFQPEWISDHLCWTGVHGINLHDLLPIPYTFEALDHVVERIRRVQDFLGRRIAIENVSSYVTFAESEMDEWTFIREMAERADCWLLLDINNVFVSSFNHGFDQASFIGAVPADRVVQLHLAGHSEAGTHKIDTHDQPICEEVWSLYDEVCPCFGSISTMIERDDNFPPFGELMAELDRARAVAACARTRAQGAAA
ncbi:MAG: MNIO family bufferin maturase [Methylocella sp.]